MCRNFTNNKSKKKVFCLENNHQIFFFFFFFVNEIMSENYNTALNGNRSVFGIWAIFFLFYLQFNRTRKANVKEDLNFLLIVYRHCNKGISEFYSRFNSLRATFWFWFSLMRQTIIIRGGRKVVRTLFKIKLRSDTREILQSGF